MYMYMYTDIHTPTLIYIYMTNLTMDIPKIITNFKEELIRKFEDIFKSSFY